MPSINKLYFKDTSFASLMQQRVYNVLLFASKYALFTIEEDGRIDEQIFNEYTSLNLRYPPRFTLVANEEEAARLLGERHFDLIMAMPSDAGESFEWAKNVKHLFPHIPIVLLTQNNRAIRERLKHEDLSAIDYIFSWLDNAELLLAIIKLVEDKMNVDEDIQQVGLQTVLFVEDSFRFYSAILPMLYKHLFTQSRAFMTEALNPHEQMLRMRGRPKILLARNYEEASALYGKYHANMLGVITDAELPKDGSEPTSEACRQLLQEIREKDPFIPIIVESSNTDNERLAREAHAVFLDKKSQTLLIDLRREITDCFGFGDFRFRDPNTGEVVMTCKNLKELQDHIFEIPDESFLYHVTHNDVSRWLYSRALFPLAEYVKARDPRHFTVADMPEEKRIIHEAILDYRRIKNRGVVAQFRPEVFDQYSNFARIGSGSMGSKGRGLAFVDAMIKRHFELEDIAGAHITIPKTVVLCTDLFSEFMERNGLYPLALSNASDDAILQAFLHAPLPEHVITDLRALIDVLQGPIAIRSSSLLEDTQYQPFAGIYSTYMIPHDPDKQEETLTYLTEAVKAVYASVFFRESKAYMEATKNVIDEEKMAVVIQEVVGREQGTRNKEQGQLVIGLSRRFYPSFSGVARSLNFYPLGDERIEEGVAEIALGLGKYIVDGGTTLRFSPAHPQHVLQTSTTEMALQQTQTSFLALDLARADFHPEVDDGFNLKKCSIDEAEADGRLRLIASTYNYRSGYLYDNILEEGHRVLTFNNILHHNAFPLAEILNQILAISQREMGCPVEIEFAVNLGAKQGEQGVFYLLQIRPIVEAKMEVKEDLAAIADSELVLRSPKALGQGLYDDIRDVVYVRPEKFDAALSAEIRSEIAHINNELIHQGRHYLLIGPGRWGSSDPWLGIPVRWSEISGASIIVESALGSYQIEPSQGTHFFQNLTSFGVAYFTVNQPAGMGFVDFAFLDSQPAVFETEHVRVVQTEKPLPGLVDGKRGIGVVKK